MEFDDHYAALGCLPDSDEEEIKSNFRDLVKKMHPDRNRDTNANAQFRRIYDARAVLLDPTLRADFDNARKQHIRGTLQKQNREFTESFAMFVYSFTVTTTFIGGMLVRMSLSTKSFSRIICAPAEGFWGSFGYTTKVIETTTLHGFGAATWPVLFAGSALAISSAVVFFDVLCDRNNLR